MSADGIIWEEPRNVRGGGRQVVWVPILTPLMSSPGRWARVKESDSGLAASRTAANLKHRKVRVPEGEWEFTSRSVDGKGYVYARYLGPEKESA